MQRHLDLITFPLSRLVVWSYSVWWCTEEEPNVFVRFMKCCDIRTSVSRLSVRLSREVGLYKGAHRSKLLSCKEMVCWKNTRCEDDKEQHNMFAAMTLVFVLKPNVRGEKTTPKLKTVLQNKTVGGDRKIFVGKVAVFFPCAELENKIQLPSSVLSVGAHVNRGRSASRSQVSRVKHSCESDSAADIFTH